MRNYLSASYNTYFDIKLHVKKKENKMYAFCALWKADERQT